MTARLTPLGLSLFSVAGGRSRSRSSPAASSCWSRRAHRPGADHARGAAGRGAAYPLTHEISADRVFEGEPFTVTITVTARSALPLVEVLEPLARDAQLRRRTQPRAARAARRRARRAVTYEVRWAGRGVHDLGIVAVRGRDRWGIARVGAPSRRPPARARVPARGAAAQPAEPAPHADVDRRLRLAGGRARASSPATSGRSRPATGSAR